MIMRTGWSPLNTPPPAAAAGSVQVSTNGRGAVVWVLPRSLPRPGSVPASGVEKLRMRQPKLMMDPRDQSTWQRPYRFT